MIGVPLAYNVGKHPLNAFGSYEAKKATVYLDDCKNGIKGRIEMRQTAPNAETIVVGVLKGLEPGLHGIHIHEFGDVSDLSLIGQHFNPHNTPHGGPGTLIRHLGDLGNIEADAMGNANFKFMETINLSGQDNVIGRALAITQYKDDLGLGKSPNSRIDGNSGPVLVAGVIGLKN